MVNEVSSQHNGNLALYAATAGQRQPPQLRTETPPQTQRPVPPAQGARAQNAEQQVSISQQGRSLAAADADGDRDNDAGETAASQQGGSAARIDQYKAVEAMVNA